MAHLMTIPWLAIALVCIAAPVFAQAPLEGRPIRAVQVSGLDNIKESVVLAQIESVPGTPYHRAVADRDIKRLDRLGVFGAIAIAAAPVEDGVRIDVTLNEVPHFIPAVALAVTDENGVSAGPALKMTSIKGHPYDVGVATRFGGETLGQFQAQFERSLQRAGSVRAALGRSRHADRVAPLRGVAGRRDLQVLHHPERRERPHA